MTPKFHLAFSMMIALPFLLWGYWGMALACIVFGGFMDIDHQLDFYLLFGRFTGSWRELSEKLERYNGARFFSPLHSWEFLILLGVLSFWFDMFIGAVVGASLHLFLDILFNERRIFLFSRFSFLFRWKDELRAYGVFRKNWLR